MIGIVIDAGSKDTGVRVEHWIPFSEAAGLAQQILSALEGE
jgi:hypothetical protein